MNIVIGIVLFALPFLLYFVSNKAILNYFSKLYYKYNKNPISIGAQILGFLFFSPIFIGFIDDELFFNPIICIGIPCLITLILVILNLKWLNPIKIIWLTFLQIVFGGMFLIRLFVWFYLVCSSFMGNVIFGERTEVTYSPFSVIMVDKDGDLSQFTHKFFYKPDYNYNTSFEIARNINDNMDAVRINDERLRLERELNELEDRKQEAMIYGMDVSGYETKERSLKSELDSLNKYTK